MRHGNVVAPHRYVRNGSNVRTRKYAGNENCARSWGWAQRCIDGRTRGSVDLETKLFPLCMGGAIIRISQWKRLVKVDYENLTFISITFNYFCLLS